MNTQVGRVIQGTPSWGEEVSERPGRASNSVNAQLGRESQECPGGASIQVAF